MYYTSTVLKITESNRKKSQSINQCCGSVKFWYGYGSVSLTNGAELGSGFGSGSGSCYFHQWPSRWQLTVIFFAYYFLKLHLHHFSKIKRHKEVTKQ
jgi:hypothetical protein